MRRVAIPLLLAGCGRLAFDPASTDGPIGDGGAPLDAAQAPDAAPCIASAWSTGFDTVPPWGALWLAPSTSLAQAAISGGELRLTPVMAAGQYAGFAANTSVRFYDRRLSLDVRQGAGDAGVFLGLDATATQDYLRVYLVDDVLSVVSSIGTDTIVLGSEVVDLVRERRWHLRERAGVVEVSVSADGAAARQVWQGPTPSVLADVIVAIGVGLGTPATRPSVARIDDLVDCQE